MNTLCFTPGCMNQNRPQRHHCNKCIKRAYRAKYPVRAAYQNLRTNAKRRAKVFTLTFKQFERFVTATEYMIKKGRTRGSFHIDRVREEDGYTDDNVQTLENGDNVRKYLTWCWDEEQRKMVYRVETIKSLNIDEF